ncbi:MAG: GIY-YIG nuclease family protein [Chlorobiaceae bacterium]|nr:GIY-YIG nuclease family protein [Chlorobiaceae bacterium]
MNANWFTLFGDNEKQGSYLLFIELRKPARVKFGSFGKGLPLPLPAGCYLYLGSALGKKPGAEPLARRLMRHASRSSGRKPHAILKKLRKLLVENHLAGPATLPPTEKRLRWHIDYLLERPESAIVHLVIIRCPVKLEPVLARYLEAKPGISAPAERLGAQDTTDSTHLLRCSDPDALLCGIRRDLPAMLSELEHQFC